MKPDRALKKPSPAPMTVGQWLGSKAKPAALLRDHEGHEIPRFGDADQAVETVLENPRQLLRVAELVRLSDRASPHVRSGVLKFARQVLEAGAPALAGWLRSQDAVSGSELRELSTVVASEAHGGKSGNAKAEGIFSLGLAIYLTQREIEPLELLSVVRQAFRVPESQGSSDTRPARKVAALVRSARVRQLTQFAQIASLQAARLDDADRRASSEAYKRTQESDRAAKLEAELARLRGELSESHARARSLETKLEETRSIASAASELNAAKLRDTEGENRRILAERLLPLAADALATLEMEPPRPDFAKGFLEDLVKAIEGART